MSRYSRHIILSEIGQHGQKKINKAKVLVVGAGGLGCPVLQYLAAAGVGTIGIIDDDLVEESNLQRQVLFGSSSLGINKAIAAKERLEDLNATIDIQAYPYRLDTSNALSLFNDYDIIMDGTDNFESRYLINDAAVLTDKPIVYGAIYKFEGQVSVFNYNNGPTYRCLFSEAPKENTIPNCSEIGVLGVLPGIIGAMQANETLKIILGFDHILTGQLYCYDALTSNAFTISFDKNDSEIMKVLAGKELFGSKSYNLSCSDRILEISSRTALEKPNAQFVDIREPDELPRLDLPDLLEIPLDKLEQNLKLIPRDKNIILICRSGVRSKKAVSIFHKHKIMNCYSLRGGAVELMAYK
ncbi:MAG: HesA/MoeB/ThiF family protein [Bacteroidia bacterium]|nr:HesA/MoeB/ThiF family protein [Bacteroidia bacterium]NND51777.1 dinucleotide-utilizing protein [Flavobacteriaceae bacterium]